MTTRCWLADNPPRRIEAKYIGIQSYQLGSSIQIYCYAYTPHGYNQIKHTTATEYTKRDELASMVEFAWAWAAANNVDVKLSTTTQTLLNQLGNLTP